ncbi:hypothetical protein TcCL_ESM02718, partial [Trypanosoma cruzi]
MSGRSSRSNRRRRRRAPNSLEQTCLGQSCSRVLPRPPLFSWRTTTQGATRQSPALNLTWTLTWVFCVSGRDGVVKTRWGPCHVCCQVLCCGDKHIGPDANEG